LSFALVIFSLNIQAYISLTTVKTYSLSYSEIGPHSYDITGFALHIFSCHISLIVCRLLHLEGITCGTILIVVVYIDRAIAALALPAVTAILGAPTRSLTGTLALAFALALTFTHGRLSSTGEPEAL
jgi:hypothetical protein